MKKLALLFLLLLLTIGAAAKDKTAPPEYTPAQKIELLRLELALVIAQKAALPYEIAAQQSVQAFQAKHEEFLNALGVDRAKWIDNLDTLTFTAVPVQPAKPAEKPGEKK